MNLFDPKCSFLSWGIAAKESGKVDSRFLSSWREVKELSVFDQIAVS